MDQFSKDFGGLHSPDDIDLLSLGLVPGQEEQAETADQDEPRINPLHDMDSLEFLLWVEQEAEREMARRKGQAAEPAPEQSPEKTGPVYTGRAGFCIFFVMTIIASSQTVPGWR